MERQAPVAPADYIDLYIRTYTSLLRSSGDVDVRAFEEAHAFSVSSLHEGALSPDPDVSAFAYAAGRLPLEMPSVRRIVLGQSHELFEAAGMDVRKWQIVKARGRRRPLRWDGEGTLGVFIASASDIDDLVPIVTAYQIEWNKMHARLRMLPSDATRPDIAAALNLDEANMHKLAEAFGSRRFDASIRAAASKPIDLKLRMLATSHSQYQRSAQRWWSGIEPSYVRPNPLRRPPVYFVSSNTHAIANLVGGFARTHKEAIADWTRQTDPEGLGAALDAALASGTTRAAPILYYLLRGWIHDDPSGKRMLEVRSCEKHAGLSHLSTPGHVDVDAQLIELSRLDYDSLDPRLRVPGVESLRKSNAIVLNIDYPLGMAAYYLLSRLGQGVGELRGVYVMGKAAATLNSRVGDVSLLRPCYDEHSRNTFLLQERLRGRATSRRMAARGKRLRQPGGAHGARRLLAKPSLHDGLLPRRPHRAGDGGRPLPRRRVRAHLSARAAQGRDRAPLRQDAVRPRHPPLRVGHAVLASPVPLVQEPELLRRRQHVRVRDRHRAAHPLAGDCAVRVDVDGKRDCR